MEDQPSLWVCHIWQVGAHRLRPFGAHPSAPAQRVKGLACFEETRCRRQAIAGLGPKEELSDELVQHQRLPEKRRVRALERMQEPGPHQRCVARKHTTGSQSRRPVLAQQPKGERDAGPFLGDVVLQPAEQSLVFEIDLRRQRQQHDSFLDRGKGEHATEMGQRKKDGAVEARPPPRVEVAARLLGLIDELARLGVAGVRLDGRKAFHFLVGDIKTLERINSVARAPVALVEDRTPDQEIEPMHLGEQMLGTVSKGGARFGHQRIT